MPLHSLGDEGPRADLIRELFEVANSNGRRGAAKPNRLVMTGLSEAGDRREAEWAESYTALVLSAATPADVVRLWRYGSALAPLGDDRTVERLRERADKNLPPSVRFWLDRIRKAVQSRWDDVVRRWPEP
jgi:hypothetical protein